MVHSCRVIQGCAMGPVLHGSATTTEAVRLAIQHSQESLRSLAKRYGVTPKTIAKWRARKPTFPILAPNGAAKGAEGRRSQLSVGRKKPPGVRGVPKAHLCCPLDDCLYTLQPNHPAFDALVASSLSATARGFAGCPRVEGEASPSVNSRLTRSAIFISTSLGSPNRRRQTLPHRRYRRRPRRTFAFVELHEKAARRTRRATSCQSP